MSKSRKFICRDCFFGDAPCVLSDDYVNVKIIPQLCPYSGERIEWKEVKETETERVNRIFSEVAKAKDERQKASNNKIFKHEYTHKDKRGKILLLALDIINGERQDQYGSPEDSFALIADYWTTFLKSRDLIPSNCATHDLKISAKEVAEMMMLFKIARMSGQKPTLDNYLDLIGYAGLAADMVEGDKK